MHRDRYSSKSLGSSSGADSMKPNPEVDPFFERATAWRAEQEELRDILLNCDLTEELKWGKPCYSFKGRNIAIIQPFKRNLSLMFFKGAVLEDPDGVLVAFGEHVRSARRMEFTSVQDISDRESSIRSLVEAAIEAERSGLSVGPEQDRELPVPAELQQALDENPALREAFVALTPGRQRGYILHVSGAKQAKTRVSRVEQCIPRILEGLGMQDR